MESCPSCADLYRTPEEIEALDLGHDPLGHRVYRILRRERITRADLDTLTDDQLRKLRNVGPVIIGRIRTLVPAPAEAAA